jgi:hypothetical protein
MHVSLPHVTGDHISRRGTELAMLLVLAAALQLAAGVGLAYVAGFSSVRAVLGDFDWVWLAAMAGALGVSFAGYYYAYEGIFTVAGGHPGARVPDRVLAGRALPGPGPGP